MSALVAISPGLGSDRLHGQAHDGPPQLMAAKLLQNASHRQRPPQPRGFALEVPTLPAPAATSSSAPARLTGGKRSGAASFGGGGNASAVQAPPFSAAAAVPTANIADLQRSSTVGAGVFMTGAFTGLFAPQAQRKRSARAIVTLPRHEEATAAPEAAQQEPGSPAKRSRPASPNGGGGGGPAAAEGACFMEHSPTNGSAAAAAAAGAGVAAGTIKLKFSHKAGTRSGGTAGGACGGGGALAKAPKVVVKLLCPVAQAPPVPLPPPPVGGASSASGSPAKPLAHQQPFDPAPTPFISAKAARCLVLDNDETTGSYQLGSLLFSMFVNLCATHPPVDLFVENYLKQGGARPGLAQLIQTAAELKATGRIDHVVVWTAASNRNGWVTFLSQCLERLAEVPPGTIDRVFTCEHSTKRHRTGRVIKDLRLLATDTSNIVMVDDKPTFVQHGRVIQVNEYTQHVPIEALVEGMPCSEENKDVARKALVHDQLTNPPAAEDQSGDTELYEVARLLRQLY